MLLTVEDDADLRDMMFQLLSVEGFDADVAGHGAEALERLRVGSRPDVILLDLMMPVMDGWTFRAHQRHDSGISDIPVVVLSAAPAHRVANVAAAGFLQKPVDFDRMLSLLRNWSDVPAKRPAPGAAGSR